VGIGVGSGCALGERAKKFLIFAVPHFAVIHRHRVPSAAAHSYAKRVAGIACKQQDATYRCNRARYVCAERSAALPVWVLSANDVP